MPTYQTKGNATHQRIFPNIPSILSHILPSDSLMPNKTHPAPGNQWWFLLNIAKSHSKTNYKIFFSVITYCQNSPGPTKTTTTCIIRYKCNTYRNQGRKKNEVFSRYLTQLKIYILTLLGNFRFNKAKVKTISWWPTTTMQKKSPPNHSKIELDPT